MTQDAICDTGTPRILRKRILTDSNALGNTRRCGCNLPHYISVMSVGDDGVGCVSTQLFIQRASDGEVITPRWAMVQNRMHTLQTRIRRAFHIQEPELGIMSSAAQSFVQHICNLLCTRALHLG